VKFGHFSRPRGFSETWWKPGENLKKFRDFREHGNNFERNGLLFWVLVKNAFCNLDMFFFQNASLSSVPNRYATQHSKPFVPRFLTNVVAKANPPWPVEYFGKICRDHYNFWLGSNLNISVNLRRTFSIFNNICSIWKFRPQSFMFGTPINGANQERIWWWGPTQLVNVFAKNKPP